MLEVNYIKENKDAVLNSLKKKNFPADEFDILDRIIELDNRRKKIQASLDVFLGQIKSISNEVGILFKSGKGAEANELKEKVKGLKESSSSLQEEQKQVRIDLENLLLQVPNITNDIVPDGNSEDDNIVTKDWSGDLPDLGENAIPHWELAKKYNIFDLELGVKLTGAGFPVYIGKGAKLQRALINFFLDEGEKAGYTEYEVPILVNADSARGTGALPDKEGQMYHVVKDEFYLIPTAEVPLTNIYRDVILKEKDFPILLTGFTPCFRREAGSYGAHVRGLNRLHQFDKVEIVQIQHPDKSYETLDKMVSYVQTLLEKLELPFRILTLCGGDTSFASALTYDFEVFSAAQKRWLEVSSISNFESFQSNRLKLRFKDKNGKTRLAHTLNGSAMALPRIVAALLENNQTEKGIKIPEALKPYLNFDIID